jgi:hypothetical protein
MIAARFLHKPEYILLLLHGYLHFKHHAYLLSGKYHCFHSSAYVSSACVCGGGIIVVVYAVMTMHFWMQIR